MNTSILLREAIETEDRWPTLGAHNLALKVPLPQIRALIGVSHAAFQLRDHIADGLSSHTHLPSDLCLRQLADALDALESV